MLRSEAFADIPAYDWRFENAKMTAELAKVKQYADKWDEVSRENIGLLLFGNVGTGKTYAAGCVANVLLDKMIPVRMVGMSDVVNRRLLQRKPMIITTNITLATMKNATVLDDRRIYDRILEVCIPVHFKGQNFREINRKANFANAIKLLGE